METLNRWAVLMLVLFMMVGLSQSRVGYAEDSGLTGWTIDGEYNHFFRVSELDDFKGTVDEIVEITPLPGMSPGVGLVVRDQDGDSVNVHLGPKSFVRLESIGLKKGDKVKLKGAWAEMGKKEVFMASKVKKGENTELKLRRTKDGVPYWALSPEELAREKGE